MRHVLIVRAAASLAVAASFSGAAVGTDPCPTCANGVTPTLAPRPKCDNQIYPLSELHYYKRYCAPVISPNATYGYHATAWRAWDGGTTPAGCAGPAVPPAAPTTALPAPTAEQPKPITPAAPVVPTAPEALPKVTPPMTPVVPPPAVPGKEIIPAPAPKPLEKKGLLRRIGALPPSSLLSPGVSLAPTGN